MGVEYAKKVKTKNKVPPLLKLLIAIFVSWISIVYGYQNLTHRAKSLAVCEVTMRANELNAL